MDVSIILKGLKVLTSILYEKKSFLVTKIFQNIFFFVHQKKEIHTGLKHH